MASIGVFIAQYIFVISLVIATVLIPGVILYGIIELTRFLL